MLRQAAKGVSSALLFGGIYWLDRRYLRMGEKQRVRLESLLKEESPEEVLLAKLRPGAEKSTIRSRSILEPIIQAEAEAAATNKRLESGDFPPEFVLMVGVDDFGEEFRASAEKALERLAALRPGLQTLKLSTTEAIAAGLRPGPLAFAWAKMPGAAPLPLPPFAFIGEAAPLFAYFTSLRSEADVARRATPKSRLLMAACGGREEDRRALQAVAAAAVTAGEAAEATALESCEGLGGRPGDLFVLRRHGPTRSVASKPAVKLGGRGFDVVRLPGELETGGTGARRFAPGGAVQRQFDPAASVRRAREAEAKLCAFDPPGAERAEWRLVLRSDFNNTSARERRRWRAAMRKFFIELPENQKTLVAMHEAHEPRAELPRVELFDLATARGLEALRLSRSPSLCAELLAETGRRLRAGGPLFDISTPSATSNQRSLTLPVPNHRNPATSTTSNSRRLASDPPDPTTIRSAFDAAREGHGVALQSSESPRPWKVSSKETRLSLPQLLKDGNDHAIFVYHRESIESTSALAAFEAAALDSLPRESSLRFHRINGPLNAMPYPAPSLLFLKAGINVPVVLNPENEKSEIERSLEPLGLIKLDLPTPPNLGYCGEIKGLQPINLRDID